MADTNSLAHERELIEALTPSTAVLESVATRFVGEPVTVRYVPELWTGDGVRCVGEASRPKRGPLIRLVDDLEFPDVVHVMAHEIAHHVLFHTPAATAVSVWNDDTKFYRDQARVEDLPPRKRAAMLRYQEHEDQAEGWAAEHKREVELAIIRAMIEEALHS